MLVNFDFRHLTGVLVHISYSIIFNFQIHLRVALFQFILINFKPIQVLANVHLLPTSYLLEVISELLLAEDGLFLIFIFYFHVLFASLSAHYSCSRRQLCERVCCFHLEKLKKPCLLFLLATSNTLCICLRKVKKRE